MIGTTSELLGNLDATQTATILALSTRIRLSAGDVLFRLGDEAEWLYSIEWGRIALTAPMQVRDRDQDILVEERGPGQLLAWSTLIAPHRLTLTATALAETELLAIPRDALLELLDAQPTLGYALLRGIAAVISQRLHVFQFMWLREMQRFVRVRHA